MESHLADNVVMCDKYIQNNKNGLVEKSKNRFFYANLTVLCQILLVKQN